MNAQNFIIPALSALLLGGCTVGPDYHPPAVNTPAQWSESLAGGEVNRAAAVAAWWKNFNDPELDSLINRAAAANLDLKMAEARVREARATAGFVAADEGPVVDANASYERELESHNQPVLGSFLPPNTNLNANVYQTGVDASWEIDLFGGTRRAIEAANAGTAAAVYDLADVQVSLLSEVARNYLALRGYQRRLAIAQQNIAAQQENLTLTQDRENRGLGSDLDVQQAATVLAQTQAQVPVLEDGIEVAVHRLGVLLAQPPGALQTELSTSAPIPAAPPEVSVGLPSELLLRRPDVRQAERALAAATAQIGVATADLFPKFSLTGMAGFESISASNLFSSSSRMWSVGPTVQWRIFDQDHIRQNIKVQNARQEEALAVYEQAALNAFEDVENALVAYGKEQSRNHALEAAVKSSQASLQLSNQLYTNGLASFINVLDAERSLDAAQDDLVQSDQAVAQDLVILYKALGGGWEPGGEAVPISPTPVAQAH